MSQKEVIEDLYKRSKKLFERLNHPSLFEEELKDSVIIANLGNEVDKENNNIKTTVSYIGNYKNHSKRQYSINDKIIVNDKNRKTTIEM